MVFFHFDNVYYAIYVLNASQVRATLGDNSYLGNFQGSLANLLTLLTLYLVRNLCPNYQGMFVSHPSYVITCFKTVPANIFEKNVRHDACVILLLPISEICKSTDYRSINVHRTLCKSFNTNPFY